MAPVLTAAASIAAFLLVFWLAGIVAVARAAIATMQGALGTMRDPGLDEMARERAVQGAAIRLVRASGSLIVRSLLALAAAFVPILLADRTGLLPAEDALAFLARWDVIVIATVAITLGYVGVRLWRR